MIIDCKTCVMRDLACGDCVVSFLAEASPEAAELSDAEARAVAVLAGSGLVPPLRMAGDPATRAASRGRRGLPLAVVRPGRRQPPDAAAAG